MDKFNGLKQFLFKASIIFIIFMLISMLSMIVIRRYLDSQLPSDFNDIVTQDGIHVLDTKLFGIPMQTTEISIINNRLFELDVVNHLPFSLMPYIISTILTTLGLTALKLKCVNAFLKG